MRDLRLTQKNLSRVSTIVLILWFILCTFPPVIYSKTEIPDELKGIGVTEHLGDKITTDLTFKDETGKSVMLSDYFKSGRPVLLNLVYYKCPSLCNFLLNGLVKGLKSLDWTPGNQFEIVTVSINPQENYELASRKKNAYIEDYGRSKAESGWHFLTGEESQIQKLSSEVGFNYRYDPKERQYAHTAVLFALTPEGKISRYLYGIEFKNQDLKLALLEASNGKVGTVVDRFLLFCFQYDPLTKKYSIYVTKLMEVACGITVLVLGTYLMIFWRRQRKEGASLQ